MMIEQQEKSKFIEKLIDWGEKYCMFIVRAKFFLTQYWYLYYTKQ